MSFIANLGDHIGSIMYVLGVMHVSIKSNVMQPKNTTSAWAVQVVSGLTSPDI